MEIESILLNLVVSIASGLIVAIYSKSINDRLQSKLAEMAPRPSPIAHVLVEPGASIRIFPTNIGTAVAHDYTISVRYPQKSKIKSIKPGFFTVKEGGVDENFVSLFREAVPPGMIWPPIHITAEEEDVSVLPVEVSAGCIEQKGMISLPPLEE